MIRGRLHRMADYLQAQIHNNLIFKDTEEHDWVERS